MAKAVSIDGMPRGLSTLTTKPGDRNTPDWCCSNPVVQDSSVRQEPNQLGCMSLFCPLSQSLSQWLSVMQISPKPAFLRSNIGKLGNGWKSCEAKSLATFAQWITPNGGKVVLI